ncbi:MAG: cryptochrome/photolyase family protein [Flavobacterium sp.]
MSEQLENGLFIFRRDLRIVDNIALHSLADLCRNVYTIFIFTPEQVGASNPYRSNNAIQFMIESLEDLAANLQREGGHLYTFYGNHKTIIADCIRKWNINMVAFNVDITPYARQRDHEVVQLCQRHQVFVTYDNDYYLCEPDTVRNGAGDPYVKFTPYYNTAKKRPVAKPLAKHGAHFVKSGTHGITLDAAMRKLVKPNPHIMIHGGRENGLKQMRLAASVVRHYAQTRDELAKPTSHLSAYLKFGCVSVREVYHAFKSNHSFIRQLYWRDFYANVLYSFPHVLGHSLNAKYDKIRWHHNTRWFDAWCKGETGIPIVDASQRQLLHIGWTHNRGRMVSSSILTKILLIDWRKGERFYAQHLTDYDVANNNGGWQWSSGGGSDAQPYFRYFNPFTQSREHDPKAEYIKTWIPELKDVPAADIHAWDTAWELYKDCGYPKPIVDYPTQREVSLKMYKDAL